MTSRCFTCHGSGVCLLSGRFGTTIVGDSQLRKRAVQANDLNLRPVALAHGHAAGAGGFAALGKHRSSTMNRAALHCLPTPAWTSLRLAHMPTGPTTTIE